MLKKSAEPISAIAMHTSYSLDIGATGSKPLKHTTSPSQYLLRGERLQHSWPCCGYGVAGGGGGDLPDTSNRIMVLNKMIINFIYLFTISIQFLYFIF